jgi:hypothetical protein
VREETTEKPKHRTADVQRRLFANSALIMACKIVSALSALLIVPFIVR